VTDAYVDMSWRGAAVPGSSVYLPGPVALGTIAMWGLAVLALSEWLQRRMNYMAWRVLHASAFGTFVIGLVHGVVSGTDSGSSGAQALYAGTAALLLGALALPLTLAPMLAVSGFPAAPEVTAIAAGMLGLWAPFVLFDGVQVVFVYALRSLGDQVIAGVNGILAFFVLTGALGLLTVHAGWGPTGLVVASAAGMVAAALLNGTRLWVVTRRLRLKS